MADLTPSAPRCKRTLAQLVCTAADRPTANSGRGAVNARRSSRERWRSMAVLVAVAAMLAVCIAPALASAVTPNTNTNTGCGIDGIGIEHVRIGADAAFGVHDPCAESD